MVVSCPSTGFSAVIPGFPRYSVVGDSRNGVYNLRILNASLGDDAEYQCQVGPARFNKAIRANARLSVICEYAHIYSNIGYFLFHFFSSASFPSFSLVSYLFIYLFHVHRSLYMI
jgi:hypothetical protein